MACRAPFYMGGALVDAAGSIICVSWLLTGKLDVDLSIIAVEVLSGGALVDMQ